MNLTTEQVKNIRAIFREFYKGCNTEADLSEMYDDIRSLLCLELEDRAEAIGLNPDTVSY